jgi:hypothetical protein
MLSVLKPMVLRSNSIFYVKFHNTVPIRKPNRVWDSDLSGFQMVKTSLDRFINKGHKKNILFMTKRSRLAVQKVRSGFQMVKTKWRPFESRTQKVSERWPFECRIVRLSDVVYCKMCWQIGCELLV